MSALEAFLGELIDDAGLFPPAGLAMTEALAAHQRYEAGSEYWMLGRFITPASRIDELVAHVDDAPEPLGISSVLDGSTVEGSLEGLGRAAQAHSSRISVEALECKFAALDGTTPDERVQGLFAAVKAAGLDGGLPVYVEVDASDPAAFVSTLGALGRARERGHSACAKLRCGGPAAGAVPPPEHVAAFVWEANRLEVPFKATAGLHHAVRQYDREAGFVMHGFLNVVGAAVLADARGLDRSTLERLIRDEDSAHFQLDRERFAWAGIGADAGEIGAARVRRIAAYGSCSFDEPLAGLRALGMLPPAA